MRFETISLLKTRVMRHESTEGQCTAWHTSLSIGLDKANEIGIGGENHIDSPLVDAIVKDGEKLYLCAGPAGTAEVGGERFIMLKDVTDYMVIEGAVYVRSHDEFSIDPVAPRDEKEDRVGSSE